MTFGSDIAEAVWQMITQDFGSLLRWRHYTRVEDASDGTVETTFTEEAITAAVSAPIHLKNYISEASLLQATSVVVVPIRQLTTPPKQLDEVEITPGQWLKVIEISEYRGPGGAGSPPLVAYLAALSS